MNLTSYKCLCFIFFVLFRFAKIRKLNQNYLSLFSITNPLYSMIVDIHTHILNDSDLVSVLNLRVNDSIVFPSGFNKQTFFSAGVHPWDAHLINNEMKRKLADFVEHSQVRLIGECGLDKFSVAPLAVQMEVFLHHIMLSEKLQKPLLIHCVGRFNELIALRKDMNCRQVWIAHGFRGKPQLARQLLDVGVDLSFGAKFNPESVVITPVERLYVETDEANVPIVKLYDEIAELKQCHPDDLKAGGTLLGL